MDEHAPMLQRKASTLAAGVVSAAFAAQARQEERITTGFFIRDSLGVGRTV
jgi:hypothetical protein